MLLFENTIISNIIDCNKVTLRQSHLFFKSRSSSAFVIILTGECEYRYKGLSPICGEPDRFVFLPSGLEYEVYTPKGATCLVINFTTENDIELGPFRTKFSNISHIKNSMIAAVNSYNRKNLGWFSEILSIIYKIIFLIQQEQSSRYITSKQKEKLASAINYIEEHYLERDIRTSELVKLCGISEKHFTTLFSRYYKTTSKQYIIDKKIDHAKVLLESTDMTVTDISDYCGFSSVYYFSRIFKRRMELSPTDYRHTILINHIATDKTKE